MLERLLFLTKRNYKVPVGKFMHVCTGAHVCVYVCVCVCVCVRACVSFIVGSGNIMGTKNKM